MARALIIRCKNGLILKYRKTRIVPDDYIKKSLTDDDYGVIKPTAKMVWLGDSPAVDIVTKSKGGNTWELAALTFQGRQETISIKVDKEKGLWLAEMLTHLSVSAGKLHTRQEVRDNYEAHGLEDFELFWDNKPVNSLYKLGLLTL